MRDLDKCNRDKRITPGSVYDLEDNEENMEEIQMDAFERFEAVSKLPNLPRENKFSSSLITRRVAIVSGLVMLAFVGIFMGSWVLEIMANGAPSNSTSVEVSFENKRLDNKKNVSERIPLPENQSDNLVITTTANERSTQISRENSAQVAIASPQSRSHLPSAKNETAQKTAASPPISASTQHAQGVSSGSTITHNSEDIFAGNSAKQLPSLLSTEADATTGDTDVGIETDKAIKKVSVDASNNADTQSEAAVQHTSNNVVPSQEEMTSKLKAPLPQPKKGEVKTGTSKLQHETLSLTSKKQLYTIQLIGMHDQDKFNAFINQSPSHLKEKFYSFQTQHQGKAWYVAAYGKFETKQQAEAALKALPMDVQKNKPWVRLLQEVQKATP